VREQSGRAGVDQEPFESLGFCDRDGASESGQSIVATTLVVMFRVGPLRQLFYQRLLEESTNRSVETARAQAKRPVGPFENVLHDRVPVSVAVSERDQNVERVPGKRQK